MWVLTVWQLFAIACTSKEVIANFIRLFVGATAEEIGNDYNPSQPLWLDAGENRGSHSLCTISVNVDCRDEFVRDCEKPLHGSSDLSRSQGAEMILLCETVNSCWQWIQSKHHVRVRKRGSYYLVNNSVRSRNPVVTQRSRSSFFIGSAWVAPLLFLGLRQLFGVLAYCVFNQWREVFLEVRGHPRNHAISVTLNLGAVRIIWPACKPVHILYIKRLHSRVRSQNALIVTGCGLQKGTKHVTKRIMNLPINPSIPPPNHPPTHPSIHPSIRCHNKLLCMVEPPCQINGLVHLVWLLKEKNKDLRKPRELLGSSFSWSSSSSSSSKLINYNRHQQHHHYHDHFIILAI